MIFIDFDENHSLLMTSRVRLSQGHMPLDFAAYTDVSLEK